MEKDKNNELDDAELDTVANDDQKLEAAELSDTELEKVDGGQAAIVNKTSGLMSFGGSQTLMTATSQSRTMLSTSGG